MGLHLQLNFMLVSRVLFVRVFFVCHACFNKTARLYFPLVNAVGDLKLDIK